MTRTLEEKILLDHGNGLSFRNLAKKHGITSSRAYRIVKSHTAKAKAFDSPPGDELPDDVAQLKALLQAERLKNELLNNMIDIADQELGINIRKKSGTRQSK
jgi:hypothetical protein